MSWLKELRSLGLNQILVTARELAEDMDIDPVFPPKRQRKRKQHFDESSANEFTPDNSEEGYRINCFNKILDQAITSLKPRFEQLERHNSLFNFLYQFHSLSSTKIRQSADKLESALTSSSDQSTDVCGRQLADEIVALKTFLPNTVK